MSPASSVMKTELYPSCFCLYVVDFNHRAYPSGVDPDSSETEIGLLISFADCLVFNLTMTDCVVLTMALCFRTRPWNFSHPIS